MKSKEEVQSFLDAIQAKPPVYMYMGEDANAKARDNAERLKIIKGISIDRLREIIEAERDERCFIFPPPLTVSDLEMIERIGQISLNVGQMNKWIQMLNPKHQDKTNDL